MKILIRIIIAHDVSVNKYSISVSVICGASLRFWENKGQINSIDSYQWFQWYFTY